MTQQFSPDVLALNPDMARKAKKSRAVTPGGKGHGHTPDAQAYTPTVKTPTERRENVRYAANWFVAMLDTWGTDTQAQRAAKAAAELVELEAREAE